MPFDPTNGYSLNLPMNYVPGAPRCRPNPRGYAITCWPPYGRRIRSGGWRPIRAGDARRNAADPLQILNLTRLPVPMHTVMKILLLLPFAALITTFLRNVVGLRHVRHVLAGAVGDELHLRRLENRPGDSGDRRRRSACVGRSLLERLRLLTVPRLSIILTIVILCVVFGVSMLVLHDARRSAPKSVLLPMVILTMLIERFHVTRRGRRPDVTRSSWPPARCSSPCCATWCWAGTKSATWC